MGYWIPEIIFVYVRLSDIFCHKCNFRFKFFLTFTRFFLQKVFFAFSLIITFKFTQKGASDSLWGIKIFSNAIFLNLNFVDKQNQLTVTYSSNNKVFLFKNVSREMIFCLHRHSKVRTQAIHFKK